MGRRLLVRILVPIAVVAALLPATAARPAPKAVYLTPSRMTFSPTTLVDPQFFASEPSVWVDRDGTVFVSGIIGFSTTTSYVWRSRDGGRTFELLDDHLPGGIVDPRHRPCTGSAGGGDTDIITDRTGRVYLADLEALNISVSWSTDGGDTWGCNTIAANDVPPFEDRQWLAPAPSADDEGPAIDAYLSYIPSIGDMEIDVTTDGGATWTKQGGYAGFTQSGNIFTSPDGTLYHPYYDDNTLYLARSTDQGKTFTQLVVSKRDADPGNEFPIADIDAAGNLYYTWVEGETFDVLWTRSSDKGAHWTKPVRLNPPASETTAFPWLAADEAGDVAVAWYGTDKKTTPDGAPDDTRWNVWLARTADGATAAPTFQVGPMTSTPMHFGRICLSGLACALPPEGDRSLGDFFEIDIAPDGSVIAAFNDNARSGDPLVGFPGSFAVVVRQDSGLGMSGKAVSAAGARGVERRGDARFPRHDPSGSNVAALDVLAPTAQAVGSTLQVRFSLGDATDLASALAAADSGIATDAYWIATWWAHDKREYVGLHLSQFEPEPDFFGGDELSAAIREPDRQVYATYPETFALTGTIEVKTGLVTIEAPLSRFGLNAQDRLHGLQLFTMTGLTPVRTFANALTVLDATPATLRSLAKAPVVKGTKKTRSKANPTATRGRTLPATGVGGVELPAVLLLIAAGGAAVLRRHERA